MIATNRYAKLEVAIGRQPQYVSSGCKISRSGFVLISGNTVYLSCSRYSAECALMHIGAGEKV